MKIINTTLSLIAVLVLELSVAYSQARENPKSLVFDGKSDVFTQATGWRKDPKDGKWVSNINVLSYIKNDTSFFSRSHYDNFNYAVWKTFTKDNKKYYILIYECLDGEYKYKAIKEDWQIWTRTCYDVFTEAQYKEIQNKIDSKSGKKFFTKTKIYGSILSKMPSDTDQEYEEKLIRDITYQMANKSYTEDVLVMNSQVVEGQDVVRFLFPTDSEYYDVLINTNYFEVSQKDFKSFLTIK